MRPCEFCKKDFESTSPQKKFCSSRCKTDNRRAQRNADKPLPEFKICQRCQKKFKPYKHTHHFCSRNCRTKREAKSDPSNPILTLDDHVKYRSFFDLIRRPERKKRTCLKCREVFSSLGNRICPVCARSPSQRAPVRHIVAV